MNNKKIKRYKSDNKDIQRFYDLLFDLENIPGQDAKEAVVYLKGVLKDSKERKKIYFAFGGTLIASLSWASTPQGVTFWNDLNRKLPLYRP